MSSHLPFAYMLTFSVSQVLDWKRRSRIDIYIRFVLARDRQEVTTARYEEERKYLRYHLAHDRHDDPITSYEGQKEA